MQSLRRTWSRKRGRSQDKGGSRSLVTAATLPAAMTIAGEISESPSSSPHSRSRSLGREPTTPPSDRRDFLQLPLNIDVVAANSLLADREISVLTSTPDSYPARTPASQPLSSSSSSNSSLPRQGQREANVMSTPTHVIIPPTPVATATNFPDRSEHTRSASEGQISLPGLELTASPPPTTPTTEDEDDPLSRHWRESPRRSSSLLRRLSRGGHRRSGSLPGDLRRTLSDPPPPSPRKEDEDDIVFIPEQLQRGMEMLRVTRKKIAKRICWIDPATACVAWDTKPSSKLHVDDIKALHSTTDARHYREQFQLSSSIEPRWLTVVYTAGPKLKALHLISSTVEEHEMWYKTLKKLRQYRKEVTGGLAFLMSPERKLNPEKSVRVIRRHWREAGGVGHETAEVGFIEVERLCWRLNVHLSSKYLKEKFDQADSEGRGKLNFEQFQEFVRLLKEREEVLKLFREYSRDSIVLSIEQFEEFLLKEQDVMYTRAELAKFYKKFSAKKLPGQTTSEGMDVDGFLAYLLSKENRILNAPDLSDATIPAIKDGPRDMTHPLNEYFISSSHNTYLLGRQLVGESSIEGYIRVLQLGCRCVEIDCWDGVDGWPVVEHGRTFGSSIKFQDVISVIAKFAFIVTPYPLILSMEIHCGLDQQIKMAKIFRETLGRELLLENIQGIEDGILPSPEDLKYKILLKIKNASEDVDDTLSDSGTSNAESGTESDTLTSPSLSPSEAGKRPPLPRRRSSSHSATGKSTSEKKARKISPVLSDMAVYTKAYKWRNFKLPESTLYNHVYSFSEPKIKELLKNSHTNHRVEKHNLRHLMRVYPGLTRVTSNNFDPTAFWKKGIQMVALNWQKYDLPMQIHEALFQGNYQHGYILKPAPLLSASHPPASHHTTPYESKPCRAKLDVHVISGQQLPRPKDYKPGQTVDPYVQIEMICPNGQGIENHTRAVRDNEFNPMWDERLSFDVVTSSREFVFVRFSLHNGDKPAASNLFASYCIRLQDLHQGYRHVPLVDLQGEKYIYSTLFVKINWQFQENINTIERLSPGKLEKRSKAKARLAKMEEASRSCTSIESSASSAFSLPSDEATGMTKIHEVQEGERV